MDIKFSLSFVDKNGKILSMIFDMQMLANDFNNSFRTVYEGDRGILLSNGAISYTS
ncbi:hypothetical protein [Campylobacter subantarcticus]|uniref:hypothetical protein n=1 Tax=Campylobacter subantarcticus TaxID=497724 RepID=UPI000ACE94CB|nr:hypothetical protein [Campylobacter subantarcticus]